MSLPRNPRELVWRIFTCDVVSVALARGIGDNIFNLCNELTCVEAIMRVAPSPRFVDELTHNTPVVIFRVLCACGCFQRLCWFCSVKLREKRCLWESFCCRPHGVVFGVSVVAAPLSNAGVSAAPQETAARSAVDTELRAPPIFQAKRPYLKHGGCSA